MELSNVRQFLDLSNVRQFLIERAGLTQETISKGSFDAEFETILGALIDIHRGKEVLYGNYIKTHGSEPETFSIVQHFCDMKRKYIRAENFVKIKSEKEFDIDLVELIDTYSDLAVYAAMGVQLLIHLKQRKTNDE